MTHRIRIVAVALALLVAGLGPATEAADPVDTRQYRLVLEDGTEHTVRGPITRREGLILFYYQQGQLGSIDSAKVRSVVQVDARAAAHAASAPSAAASYSNADLRAVKGAGQTRLPASPSRVSSGPGVYGNADLPSPPPEPEPPAEKAAPKPEGKAYSNDDLPES